MNSRFLWLALAAVALSTKAAPVGSSADSPTARVDKLFAEWDRTNSPGCGLAISRNGVLVYEHGYGMASLELAVPITPASILPAASISKQFTALSILLLAQRGQLSLDDPVWKFIPEWLDREHRVTIRHLLTHTSGLREAFTLIGVAAAREDGVNMNDAVARMLGRQRGLNFVPGAEFQYNNGAYNLLGTIVKRLSGQSLRDFAEANIFKPLGMTHTHFHDDPGMLVPNRVTGYSRGKDGFRLARPEGGIVGNAGLFTTAADLLKWEQNFADPRVGELTLLAEMQKPAVPTDWGDGSFYGFGLSIGEHRGLRTIAHGGGDPGIATYVVRYPDQGFAVAVLGNLDDIGAMMLTRAVADIYLAASFPMSSTAKPPADPPAVTLPLEQLTDKAGLYRDPTTENLGKIFVRDGKLMASAGTEEENSVTLTPLDANRFIIPGTTVMVEFSPASKDHPQESRETGNGLKPRTAQKLAPITVSSGELREFAGEYASPEIETTCIIIARESDLLVRIPGRADASLLPIFKDGFRGFGVTKFSRDATGSIDGFTFNRNDVRGLRFDRSRK